MCGGSSRGVRLDLPLDLAAHRALGDIRIVTALKIDPEVRRRPEIAPQAQHDVVQPRTPNRGEMP